MLWFNYSAKCVLTLHDDAPVRCSLVQPFITSASGPILMTGSCLSFLFAFYALFFIWHSLSLLSLFPAVSFVHSLCSFFLWKCTEHYCLLWCCISRHLAVSMFACKSTLSQVKNDGNNNNGETMTPLESILLAANKLHLPCCPQFLLISDKSRKWRVASSH